MVTAQKGEETELVRADKLFFLLVVLIILDKNGKDCTEIKRAFETEKTAEQNTKSLTHPSCLLRVARIQTKFRRGTLR